MYLTQAVIAFSGTFFLGPALLFGMTRALPQGAGHVITFMALFGMVNGIGGLAGTAALGTFQIEREKAHSAAIVQTIEATDPMVIQRMAAGGGAVGRVLADPSLRSAEGAALLSQNATREANVLAYNDVFRLISLLAALTTAYLGFLLVRQRLRIRRAATIGQTA
jgi:hypothetical protein